jgi:uncharacterized protein (TIGR02996 family)
MSTPPAHRRLVPRRPRPSSELDDLEVTKKRIVIDPPADDPEDLDPTVQRQLPPPAEDAFAEHPVTERTSLAELEPTTLHAPPTKSGIEDRPTAHPSPAEYGLLAAIAEGHEPSRLRYADWLERRGEPARAELLRLDHALHELRADDPRVLPSLQQLRELAPRVSADWRSRVSRAAIEGCSAYGVTCPMHWRALPPDADDVRTCPACHDQVYYCATIRIARDRVHEGQRVALDMACERWPHDLHRQCDGCSRRVSPHSRFCPHCGRAMPSGR